MSRSLKTLHNDAKTPIDESWPISHGRCHTWAQRRQEVSLTAIQMNPVLTPSAQHFLMAMLSVYISLYSVHLVIKYTYFFKAHCSRHAWQCRTAKAQAMQECRAQTCLSISRSSLSLSLTRLFSSLPGRLLRFMSRISSSSSINSSSMSLHHILRITSLSNVCQVIMHWHTC